MAAEVGDFPYRGLGLKGWGRQRKENRHNVGGIVGTQCWAESQALGQDLRVLSAFLI